MVPYKVLDLGKFFWKYSKYFAIFTKLKAKGGILGQNFGKLEKICAVGRDNLAAGPFANSAQPGESPPASLSSLSLTGRSRLSGPSSSSSHPRVDTGARRRRLASRPPQTLTSETRPHQWSIATTTASPTDVSALRFVHRAARFHPRKFLRR